MVLVDWEDLPVATRRSPRKIYKVIQEAINGSSDDGSGEGFDITIYLTNGLSGIQGAAVRVFDENHEDFIEETTDIDGNCIIEGVSEGQHDVEITIDNFSDSYEIYVDDDNTQFDITLGPESPILEPSVA